ncbi:hypothetical protein VB779_07725 [Haloarculaceae archaeon H-GB11]|nr:hypothetical protein [Haloarculaceae archaeon H-GB11]
MADARRARWRVRPGRLRGVAFILLAEADVGTVAASILGNTVTHGLLFGAIPLVVLYPVVRDRVAERLPSVAA